jgi:hypothetical protein
MKKASFISQHLQQTLDRLETSVSSWDKIVSEPIKEKSTHEQYIQQKTQSLFVQLKKQIEHLSEPPTALQKTISKNDSRSS